MDIKTFIKEPFQMILKEESLYITNYKDIFLLEKNHIGIHTEKNTIHIYGPQLKMKKIVDKELLLKGNISKIEVQYE